MAHSHQTSGLLTDAAACEIDKGALFVFTCGSGSEFSAAYEDWYIQHMPPPPHVVVVLMLTPDYSHVAIFKREGFARLHPQISALIESEAYLHPGSSPTFFHYVLSGEEFLHWTTPPLNARGGSA